MSKRGKIIVIVAPSGTGKSTLIRGVMDIFQELQWSVSHTTRPIREGERNGVDYYFIERELFLKKRDKGEFVEWAEVHGNFYGTLKSFVQEKIKEGTSLLFDLDVQGVDNMKREFGSECQAIFISPPSFEELERRLTGRATDSESVIKLRLDNAKNEMIRKDDYDFLVINDELDKAQLELENIIKEILES